VIKADFEDPASLTKAFLGCDAVFGVTGAPGWRFQRCDGTSWSAGMTASQPPLLICAWK
jgi:hypothetical protein